MIVVARKQKMDGPGSGQACWRPLGLASRVGTAKV